MVVIGDVCLNKSHKPPDVSVIKTNMITCERQSIFQPCPNKVYITDDVTSYHEEIGAQFFQKKGDDDQIVFSLKDRQFLGIMNDGFVRDEDGIWKAPFPFKSPRPQLKINIIKALKSAQTLESDLNMTPLYKKKNI